MPPALDAVAQPLTLVAAEHARPVGVREAAATLMIDETTFNGAFFSNIALMPPEAMVLQRSGGTLSRDTWNRIFAELVSALELGASCDTHDADACR